MHKIKLDGWKCLRCKHQWVPNSPDRKPKVCPKCKSPYWDRERKSSNNNLLKDRPADKEGTGDHEDDKPDA